MTDELTLYRNDYARWAEDRAPIRVAMMRTATDLDALRLWRAGRDEMRAAIWALADDELRERIRKLTADNPV